jgi:primosomal protein N' (replication factor Y) (superfamily II helicase)
VTLVARVLPDIRSSDKTFDYLVPDELRDQVRVGTMVRVELHGRRVGGWVVDLDTTPPAGVRLKPIAKVSGEGPPPEVVDLARWAAWRWAGRLAPLLGTASPPTAVLGLPAPTRREGSPVVTNALALDAFVRGRCVVRWPPAVDVFDLVLAAAALGNALVVTPSLAQARHLALRLRRAGVPVALHPREWAVGAAGATVVGTRTAVFAPVGRLAAVVVIDEHDESLKEEQTIAWHARDIALERAGRAGVPCVLASPVPSLDALAAVPLLTLSRNDERAGWPLLEVVDRSGDEPRERSLVTPALVRHLRSDARVVCVLNTKGRARLLACTSCGELARCEACAAAVVETDAQVLVCPRCGVTRPVVCARCSATRLKRVRPGTARLREELEAAAGEAVIEVVAGADEMPEGRLFVGTEAVLHQLTDADVVAFLDLDAELLAPRYRANEEALALLARAARLVGGRAGGGRLLVQTHLRRHEVLDAVLLADPGRLVAAERARRAELRFPPAAALAAVSGPAAPAYVELLQAAASPGIELLGPSAGTWLVRAGDHATLCNALAATPRPKGRLRIEVDPLRL